MASSSSSSDSHSTNAPTTTTATMATFRTTRRRLSFRRRKLPTVRLGGNKKPRKGFFLVRLFRRVKLKSLKNKYFCMLKKLKNYYTSLVKDIIEAGGTIESFHQRVLLETSFAVPVMGISFNSFPNNYGLDHHRS
ncbi:hypothetical protein ACH5RR_007903 [Cinchona calisaya]|uniref:Uncharacterized protein n=1 Tax=Cinchona calisaya TaxID=153742 RepID=A0ABD3ACG4_9GENT